MRAMRILAALACAAITVGAARAEEHEAAPAGPPLVLPASPAQPLVDLVRDLQRVQDGVATGDATAPGRQIDMMSDAARLLAEMGTHACEDHRGIRALVVLLLSGGDPRWGGLCAGASKPPAALDAKILSGAAAYAAGQGNVAQNAFSGIDPMDLDASLGGQLALVRASLVAGDRPLGLHLLDVARLMQPGGLVEEAAIRQQMFVLARVGDTEKFSLLARQYIARFPKSLYAENFVQGFVRGAIDLGLTSDERRFATLRDAIDLLKPSAALSVYLLVARRGLLTGELNGARRAAAAARALAAKGSPEAARADLYDAAGAVVSPRWAEARDRLRAVQPASLPPRDALLRVAALALADQIDAPLPTLPFDKSPSPSMKRAEAALEKSDRLLAKAQP